MIRPTSEDKDHGLVTKMTKDELIVGNNTIARRIDLISQPDLPPLQASPSQSQYLGKDQALKVKIHSSMKCPVSPITLAIKAL